MKKRQMPPQLRKYDKKIHSIIPRNYPHRQEILSSIRQDITSYFSEYPAVSYEDIIEHFGTPEEMALSFVETLSMEDIISHTRRQRKIHILFVSILVGLGTILLALIVYFYLGIQASPVSIDETIIIYEETTVDPADSVLD